MMGAQLAYTFGALWIAFATGPEIPDNPFTSNPVPIVYGLPPVDVESIEPDPSDPVFTGNDWTFAVEPSPATADYASAFAWVQVQVKNPLNDVFEILRYQAASVRYAAYRNQYFANLVGNEFTHRATWWCIQTQVAGELEHRYIVNGTYYTDWLPVPKVNCYNGEFNANGSPYPPYEAPWIPWPR